MGVLPLEVTLRLSEPRIVHYYVIVDLLSSFVAVQGLGGNLSRTWVPKDQEIIWLRVLLGPDIPNAGIASWGYNSKFCSTVTKITA
jgi:hypothetical protein